MPSARCLCPRGASTARAQLWSLAGAPGNTAIPTWQNETFPTSLKQNRGTPTAPPFPKQTRGELPTFLLGDVGGDRRARLPAGPIAKGRHCNTAGPQLESLPARPGEAKGQGDKPRRRTPELGSPERASNGWRRRPSNPDSLPSAARPPVLPYFSSQSHLPSSICRPPQRLQERGALE